MKEQNAETLLNHFQKGDFLFFFLYRWVFFLGGWPKNLCSGSHIVHRPPDLSRNSGRLLTACKSFTSPSTLSVFSPLSFFGIFSHLHSSFMTQADEMPGFFFLYLKSCLMQFEHSSSYQSQAQ